MIDDCVVSTLFLRPNIPLHPGQTASSGPSRLMIHAVHHDMHVLEHLCLESYILGT